MDFFWKNHTNCINFCFKQLQSHTLHMKLCCKEEIILHYFMQEFSVRELMLGYYIRREFVEGPHGSMDPSCIKLHLLPLGLSLLMMPSDRGLYFYLRKYIFHKSLFKREKAFAKHYHIFSLKKLILPHFFIK